MVNAKQYVYEKFHLQLQEQTQTKVRFIYHHSSVSMLSAQPLLDRLPERDPGQGAPWDYKLERHILISLHGEV